MGQEIFHTLQLILILVIVLIVLGCLWGYKRIRDGLVHDGHKRWTKENFRDAPVAQHINEHYEARERKHVRRIKRAERILKRNGETNLIGVLARKILYGNQKKLGKIRASKSWEMSLTEKIFFSPRHGPKMRGDGVSHGIGRERFGTRASSHEINSKRRGK
jgi:hypothetical protein